MNIARLLTRSACTCSNRLALRYGSETWTYGEFNQRVSQLAAGLQALGLKPGDRVAAIMYNHPRVVETFFACFRAGMIVVPMNNRLHPREFLYMIENSGARAVVADLDFAAVLKPLAAELVNAPVFITPGGEVGLDYESVISGASPLGDVDVAPDQAAWIFYTSGTTGQPKGAMLSHRSLLAMTMSYFADQYPMQPEDVVMHSAPLTHGSGLYVLPGVAKGAQNIITVSRSFSPPEVFATMRDHGVTNIAFLTPTMIKMLMSHPDLDKVDVSKLRRIAYGGGPMYVEDLKEACTKWGKIFVQLYGQAECPMTISYLRPEDHHLEGPESRVLASAGIARTNMEMRILDHADREVATGEIGQVCARGDVVMQGYWDNPKATAEALRGGWLHTGDIGKVDEDGFLYLLDRSKDVIISGGSNIYPREVEEVLLQHPEVYEVAVVGAPDDFWGESVVAVVSLVPGARSGDAIAPELVTLCQEQLAGYKKPRRIDFVDQIPKNAYGKILKREVRDRYWQERERKI